MPRGVHLETYAVGARQRATGTLEEGPKVEHSQLKGVTGARAPELGVEHRGSYGAAWNLEPEPGVERPSSQVASRSPDSPGAEGVPLHPNL